MQEKISLMVVRYKLYGQLFGSANRTVLSNYPCTDTVILHLTIYKDPYMSSDMTNQQNECVPSEDSDQTYIHAWINCHKTLYG